MPEVDFAGLRTVAMEAARQPEFREIERRVARLRRRRRLTSGAAAAAAVVLAVAGTAYAVGGFQDAAPDPAATPGPAAVPGKPPSGPVRRVVHAHAGDANHLYAVTQSCDKPPYGNCPYDLYGSDDAGRTWHGRTLPDVDIEIFGITVLGPRTVLAGGAPVSQTPPDPGTIATGSRRMDYLSVDGGATWRELTESAEPIDAVPAGHSALGCAEPPPPSTRSPSEPPSIESCTVRVVDPVRARVASLANQPPIVAVGLSDAPPEAGLWVTGFDPGSHRPAVAWSRDAGRTWITHVFAEADPVPTHSPPGFAPQLATADGRTAYAMVSRDDDIARIYRTVDAGATWSLFQEGDRAPSFIAFVAGDGAHLLMLQNYGGAEYLASRNGGPYRPQSMTGVPGTVDLLPQAMAGGGYITAVEADPTAVYLSDDGLSWRRIAIE
jgi:hypothetical protein